MAKQQGATRRLVTILAIVVVLLVILGVIGAKSGWFGNKTNAKEVETSKVRLKTITQLVSATGTIEPVTEVKISPSVSGEIIDLPVQEGDYVHKGDLLLQIKPDLYKASIDQLQANLLAQKAQMEQNRADLLKAEANFKQQNELNDKGVISKMDFITAKSNYEAAQASFNASNYQVQNAEAQLRRAKEELQQTIIRAPMDGTVSQLNVKNGETVVGSSQMQGTDLMHIARMGQMQVEVNVNENDIVNVEDGDTTRIEVDAYPGKKFNGVVTEIANSATVTGAGTNEQMTNYLVKIKITSRHNEQFGEGNGITKKTPMESKGTEIMPVFKPGMTASVDVETQTVANAIAVPIQAVTVRDFSKVKSNSKDSASTKKDIAANDTKTTADTSSSDLLIPKEDLRKVVFVVDNGKARRVQVKTGISDETHLQIIEGVKPGDDVIVGPYRVLSRELSDGDAVKVNNNKYKLLAEQQ